MLTDNKYDIGKYTNQTQKAHTVLYSVLKEIVDMIQQQVLVRDERLHYVQIV